MSEYIVGLKDYAARLQAGREDTAATDGYLDLAQFPLEGVQVVDSYTYRIKVKGKYPQFVYWLAMPFFAPVPWEAERFYAQPGMADGKNLSLDWYPVGTGAYMLTVNNPEPQMVLERNPNFRGEPYPSEGEPGDEAGGTAARRRQDHALHRQGGVQPGEGKHPVLEQVPAGLLRRVGHQLRQLRPGGADDRERRRRRSTDEMRRAGHPAADLGCDLDHVPRLQHARSGGRAAIPSARASCARRSPSPSTRRNSSRSSPTAAASPPRGRSRRASSAIARARKASTRYVYDWVERQAASASPSSQAKKLLAEAGYPGRHRQGRPASRWSSISTRR